MSILLLIRMISRICCQENCKAEGLDRSNTIPTKQGRGLVPHQASLEHHTHLSHMQIPSATRLTPRASCHFGFANSNDAAARRVGHGADAARDSGLQSEIEFLSSAASASKGIDTNDHVLIQVCSRLRDISSSGRTNIKQ